MAVDVVIGAQWGDEGKGKVVDIFAGEADVVVRFQGGNNAGHTLVIDGEETILHHIPSGILRPDARCVVAGGVVVDPGVFLDEVDALRERGYVEDPAQLTLGADCSIIMPYHRRLDVAREDGGKSEKIGTTGRGIGPCYEDRVGRRSVFTRDLLQPDVLEQKVSANLYEKNVLLERLDAEPLDAAAIVDEYAGYGARLREFVSNAGRLVRDAIASGERVLMEGAQGTMLDIGLGTYPFVTSSHTVAGSACVGVGVSPRAIDRIVGVTKAYCTRVGRGPFPTELEGEVGESLRDRGAEFGSTTGRPRRCGWLDAAALRYAGGVNGFTSLAMTKLDVLSGTDTIRVGVGYTDPETGDEYDEPPLDWRVLERVEPRYVDFAGWEADITAARSTDHLPDAARTYVERVEEIVDMPVSIVSVGPARTATFER